MKYVIIIFLFLIPLRTEGRQVGNYDLDRKSIRSAFVERIDSFYTEKDSLSKKDLLREFDEMIIGTTYKLSLEDNKSLEITAGPPNGKNITMIGYWNVINPDVIRFNFTQIDSQRVEGEYLDVDFRDGNLIIKGMFPFDIIARKVN